MPPKADPLGPKHFPCTQAEADAWASRMEDVSAAITDFLSSTPEQDEERKRARDERKRLEAIAADKERRRRRYNTQFYARYESDEAIDKMLAEADLDDKQHEAAAKRALEAKRRKEQEGLSEFEKMALEQGNKLKAKGNDAVKAGDWGEAFAHYSSALAMQPADDALVLALTNNRAMANMKLGNWEGAVTDATFVLRHEPYNAKAMLRRARGLLSLHRPSDALADIEKVLRAESKNIDAIEMREEALREQDEIAWADRVRAERPDDVHKLVESTRAVATAAGKFRKVLSFEQQQGVRDNQEGGASSSAALTSPAARVLSTDEQVDSVVEDASLALCSVGALLHDGGMCTVFRMARGLEHLKDFFTAAVEFCGLGGTGVHPSPPHARVLDSPAGVIFVASLLRCYARAIDTPVSAALTVDDAAFAKKLLLVASSVSGSASPHQRAKAASVTVPPQTMLAATAGMQVMASLSADPRRFYAKSRCELRS
jgi:hypothetical protein